MAKISNLARKIGKGLGEYFLGLDTYRHYQYEKRFWQENLERNSKAMKKATSFIEFYELFMGKTIPNIILGTSISSSIYFKNPYWLFFIGAGESFRIFGHYDAKKKHEKDRKVRQTYIKSCLDNEKFLEEMDKLERKSERDWEKLRKMYEDGEGWKIGTDYESTS